MKDIDNAKIQVKFEGSCARQEKVTLNHKQVVNSYTVYEKNLWSYTQGTNFMLGISLFKLLI